jgi:ATP-binding cassette subfamily F protein 3
MMLRNIANKLVIFHNGGAEYFDGTYDDFLEKIGWESEEVKPKTKEKLSSNEIKQRRAFLVIERAKKTKPIQDEIEFLEADITKNEELLKRITEELSKASVVNDTQRLNDFTHAVGKLNQLIENLFEKLTVANENLEHVNHFYESELAKIS